MSGEEFVIQLLKAIMVQQNFHETIAQQNLKLMECLSLANPVADQDQRQRPDF